MITETDSRDSKITPALLATGLMGAYLNTLAALTRVSTEAIIQQYSILPHTARDFFPGAAHSSSFALAWLLMCPILLGHRLHHSTEAELNQARTWAFGLVCMLSLGIETVTLAHQGNPEFIPELAFTLLGALTADYFMTHLPVPEQLSGSNTEINS